MLLQSANDASVETDMFVLMEGEALPRLRSGP